MRHMERGRLHGVHTPNPGPCAPPGKVRSVPPNGGRAFTWCRKAGTSRPLSLMMPPVRSATPITVRAPSAELGARVP